MVAEMILIGSASGTIILMAVFVVRRLRQKPSDFAAGVALSLVNDSTSWDYQGDETWLLNHKASIGVSLQLGNFGRVNTLRSGNRGSDNIIQFAGADLRAFRIAFARWQKLTAMERQRVAEKRKRDALAALE